MMMRDQFASAALNGLLQWQKGELFQLNPVDLVDAAYGFADEMLKRQKPEQPEILELACAVADAWASSCLIGTPDSNVVEHVARLEIATRPLAMRKVRL